MKLSILQRRVLWHSSECVLPLAANCRYITANAGISCQRRRLSNNVVHGPPSGGGVDVSRKWGNFTIPCHHHMQHDNAELTSSPPSLMSSVAICHLPPLHLVILLRCPPPHPLIIIFLPPPAASCNHLIVAFFFFFLLSSVIRFFCHLSSSKIDATAGFKG